MKKLSIIFSSVLILAVSACKKESSGDNVLQGTFVPAYVDFNTANLTIDRPVRDSVVNLTFTLRTAYAQKITATYNVTGTVTLTNQTVVIDKNTTSAVAGITVPGGSVVAPAIGTLVVSLIKATLADGTLLRLGAQGAVDKPRTRTIKIGG